MSASSCRRIAPGVWRLDLGRPEAFVPSRIVDPRPDRKGLAALPAGTRPFAPAAIRTRRTARGFEAALPLGPDEHLYGLGLQLLSLEQTGLKKTLRVNSDPRADLGDSHAPVPLYLSTAGYAVLADTARYATFYCGSARPASSLRGGPASGGPALDTEALYGMRAPGGTREVVVEIPGAAGVTLFLFAGPTVSDALRRYNLFSGGGCLPPRWALGVWYRSRGDFGQEQVAAQAAALRAKKIPCDVLGLEPGWQSHAYPCSHVWSEAFPDPAALVAGLRRDHFRANLWTHAFTHPDSPLFAPLRSHAGEHAVFGGLVPDFARPAAEKLFAAHYRTTAAALGVSGYKLDECDGSDFIHSPWSFPEAGRFPSGADGEQMHSLFGLLQQRMMDRLHRDDGRRTFGLVRNSHAFAAPYPFALYSDLYDLRQFVRGVATASLSGLLWAPEVREAASGPDLVRRLQGAVLSPLAQINAWYIKNPPWEQWEIAANNRDELLPDAAAWRDRCRAVLHWRMRLVPYLHAAFYRYWKEGVPPCRALVLDYPREKEAWRCDDQFLLGDRLLAAPFTDDAESRRVWLPPGEWVAVEDGRTWKGGQTIEIGQDGILPLFVKQHSLLPLAAPTAHTDDPASFHVEVRVYGRGSLAVVLPEDHAPDAPPTSRKINLAHLRWNRRGSRLSVRRDRTALPPLYSFSATVV